MACDPKVAGPGDEDAELEQDDDGDEDGDEDGQTSVGTGATSGADDDGVEPGTSAGTTPDEPPPECEGEECPDVPPPVMHAYAIRYGDLPPIDVDTSTDTGGSGGSGGDEIDPDTLVLNITTGPDSCDDPWASLQCGQWSISIMLPPGTEVGAYALLEELTATQTATGPDDGSGECWWGGGSLEGTLELDSLAGPITGRIVDAESFDFDPNVEFSAVLCE